MAVSIRGEIRREKGTHRERFTVPPMLPYSQIFRLNGIKWDLGAQSEIWRSAVLKQTNRHTQQIGLMHILCARYLLHVNGTGVSKKSGAGFRFN